MKKGYKTSGAIFTAMLYSIVVLLFAQRVTLTDSPFSGKQPTENQVHLRAVPADFFGIPLNQEPAFNLFRSAEYSGSDFQHKEFYACLKHFEKTISSEFVQYIFQAYNFPVKLRKADLLFPFHYFW